MKKLIISCILLGVVLVACKRPNQGDCFQILSDKRAYSHVGICKADGYVTYTGAGYYLNQNEGENTYSVGMLLEESQLQGIEGQKVSITANYEFVGSDGLLFLTNVDMTH